MTRLSRSVLRFDGVDDAVELGRKPEHKILRDITMEAWIFPTRASTYAGILSRVFDTNDIESGYGLALDGQGGLYACIRTSGVQSFYYTSGAATISLNKWQHVAATYDGNQLTIYINGERKSVTAISGTIDYDPDHFLTIGVYRDNDELIAFPGKIAEVRLWKVARTAAQINETKDFALRGNEEGLVGYWPLDEGKGATVSDRSQTGHHGQVSGATWEHEEVDFGGVDEERLARERAELQRLYCGECEEARDSLKRAAEEQQAKLATQSRQLAEQSAALATQTAALAEQSRKLAELSSALGTQADELAKQRTLLAELRSALTQKDAQVEAQNIKLADLQRQLQGCAACEEERASALQQLTEQRKKTAALEDQLRDLLAQKPAEIPPLAPSPKSPPLWPPPAAPAKVGISYIHFVGSIKGSQADEYLEIKNTGGTAQDVSGWHVHAGNTGQDFRFPAGCVLQPGQTFRVHTNQHTGLPGHFSFESKRPIWNDNGDMGLLCDASGVLVSEYGYGSKETRSLDSIKATYGVEGLRIVLDPDTLEQQRSSRGKVDILTAVERAIRSLLDDPASADAPNAANQIRDNYEGVPAGADDALIQRFIRQHLNSSQLRLLSEDSAEKSELEVSTSQCWIFLLKPGLGDLHWVIVDRSGARGAYQQIS